MKTAIKPDWIGGDPADLRLWRKCQPDVLSPVLPDDVTIQPVPRIRGGGLMCRPDSAVAGTIVHFHGGGFVTGTPYTHRCVGARIASATRRNVWLCPWPLAPEAILPEQSITAAGALCTALSVHGGPLILSGDSAGALVALWAWSLSGLEVRRRVTSVVLYYGYFGLVPESGSAAEGLGPRAVRAMHRRVDPAGYMKGNRLHDPLNEDFRLPDNLIVVGAESDPLLGNSTELVARWRRAKSVLARGEAHGFLSTERMNPEARLVLERVALLLDS